MTLRFDRRRFAALWLSGLLACVALESSAHAQEQFSGPTWGKASGSVGLRYGTESLNLGFGAHGGYTISTAVPGIYVGGLFDYFLGESEDLGVASASFSAWLLMAEGGYDFGLIDALIIRPVFAFGVVGVTAEVCSQGLLGGAEGCVDTGDTDLEFGVGGHVVYAIGSLTVGGELRILFGNADAFVLGGNVGLIL